MSITRAPRPESNFYILDKRISEDSRLSWGARGLLIFLLGKPDSWNVSVNHLRAETTNTAKPTGRDGVYGLLDELIQAGYVIRSQEKVAGSFSNNSYVVHESPLPENPYTAPPLPDLPYTAKPTQVSIDLDQGSRSTKDSKNNSAFEAFWKLYPKKTTKAATLKAWEKIKEAEVPEIMKALAAWRLSKKWQDGFIQDPVNWVKGRRWEDELDSMHAAAGDSKNQNRGADIPTRAQVLARGVRADGKVPHQHWDSGVHQFVYPVDESIDPRMLNGSAQ